MKVPLKRIHIFRGTGLSFPINEYATVKIMFINHFIPGAATSLPCEYGVLALGSRHRKILGEVCKTPGQWRQAPMTLSSVEGEVWR